MNSLQDNNNKNAGPHKLKQFIDSGLNYHEIHLSASHSQGYYINVSVIGLKAYKAPLVWQLL